MSERISARWGVPKAYQWTDIPNFVLFNYIEAGLTNTQMMLVMHLASFIHDSEETEGSHPSVQTLADRMGVEYASMFAKLKELEATKLVKVYRRPGYTSIYDFQALVDKCLELQQNKGVSGKSETYPSEKSEAPRSQENLRRRIELDQEEKKRKEVQSPSPFLPDQSQNQNQDRPTNGHERPAKKTPKASSAPTAISNSAPSDVYDTPDWLPANLPMPDLPKPKKGDAIPAHWTAFHLAILRLWLNVSGKPFNTKIQQTEGIYAAWVDKTHLQALSPAIVADFRRWYYEQDSVIELAQKSNALAKHPSEAVNMPSEPDKVAKWINLYVADYQADLERRQANIWQGEQIRVAAKRAEQPLVLPLVLQGLQGRRGNQEGVG